jgi:signal transduction histidine kinase
MMSAIRNVYRFLLAAHPIERPRDLLFQEEARTERLSNLIRMCLVTMWLIIVGGYSIFIVTPINVVNLSVGGFWLFVSALYHVWLRHHPYHPSQKFISTTCDMLVVTGLLVAYAWVAGSTYVLKMATYTNYLCFLALAALRFSRPLAVYSGLLVSGLLLSFWIWLGSALGIDFGTRMEHAYTGKVNIGYLLDVLMYMFIFAFLTIVAVYNIRRQVNLRAAGIEIAAREKERALLAAGLMHEIKNPLAGIRGATQILQEAGKSDEHLTTMILSDADRLNDVIEDFLQYARPFSVRRERVDISCLVEDFCREQNRLVPQQPLNVVNKAAALIAVTDPQAVRQILLNLVQNSRRVQPNGRPILVTLESSFDSAFITVDDEGPGVDVEAEANLFEPYFSTSAGGNGLGLVMSRKLARALGGGLTYERRPIGARFVLNLPNQNGELS